MRREEEKMKGGSEERAGRDGTEGRSHLTLTLATLQPLTDAEVSVMSDLKA